MHTINSTIISYRLYFSRIAAVMACACAVSALLYGIFLLEAVQNTGGRQNATAHIRASRQHLSALESQYLARTEALTNERALAMGYVAPTSVATVKAISADALSFQSR